MYFRTDNIMIDFSRVEVIWKDWNYINIEFHGGYRVGIHETEIKFDELLDAWQNRLQSKDNFVLTSLKKK